MIQLPIAYPLDWPQFFTATNLDWKFLLANKANKEIIIQSLQYLVKTHAIRLHAFVIMSNHFHLVWQPMPGHSYQHIHFRFMKHTGQQLKLILKANHPALLAQCKVDKADREYQIWRRNALSIPLFSRYVYEQKIRYIHYNPVRAGICQYPEQYLYSSAEFYFSGKDRFNLFRQTDF